MRKSYFSYLQVSKNKKTLELLLYRMSWSKHTPDDRHQNSEGEMSTLLFQLDKLQSCTGAAKCIILPEGLDIQGNHEEMLCSWLVCIATDAVTMMSWCKGATTPQCENIKPSLTICHWINHKLDIKLCDAVKWGSFTSLLSGDSRDMGKGGKIVTDLNFSHLSPILFLY